MFLFLFLMTLIRFLIRIIPSEPRLPISVIRLLPLGVLERLLVDVIQERRRQLPRDHINEPRRDPAARVRLRIIINVAPALFALPDHVAALVRPAANDLVDLRAVLVDDALVEDDPCLGLGPLLALGEDLPRSVVAEIAVSDGERHLGGVVADLVEGVCHLDDRALEHVVVPRGAEVVVVQHVVEHLGLDVGEVGQNLDAHDGVALGVAGVHLRHLVLRRVRHSPVVDVVAEIHETLELGVGRKASLARGLLCGGDRGERGVGAVVRKGAAADNGAFGLGCFFSRHS